MTADTDYSIDIVDVAIDLLEFLLKAGPKFQEINEITRNLSITRSRTYRILKTLEARGFVEFDKETQGYQLGLKLLEMGETVREHFDLRRVAEPYLRKLAQKTGDVSLLIVLRNDVVVCIDQYQGSYTLQGSTTIGVALSFHVGASPKMLLAYLPPAEQERIINKIEFTTFTPYTIKNRQELQKSLLTIRNQGYAIDIEEYEMGINAIGAPIRDYKGDVIAGVTLTTPAVRWDENRKRELIELTLETAAQISEQLKFKK